MNLKQVVNVTDWDGIKLFHHDLWTNDVHSIVKKCFGSLIVNPNEIDNKENSIHYSTIEDFRNLYVVDYENHLDEKEVISHDQLSTFINEDHIHCYNEIISWSTNGIDSDIRMDVNRSMYENYPEERRLIHNRFEKGYLLCGRRGAGKTSLIQYNIDLQKNDGQFFYVKIDMDRGSLGSETKAKYLKNQLIWEFDKIIDNLTPEVNDQYIVERYKYFWKGPLGNLLPSVSDSTERIDEKRKRREDYLQELINTKYENEFINYLICSIMYLEKITAKHVVLAIDDIDHMESHMEAREVCGEAANIQEKINRPIILAIREETFSKISAKPATDKLQRVHVTPPSFRKALQLRLEAFVIEVRRTQDLNTSHYSKQDLIKYVTTIVNSILDKNVYSRLVTFHYDMDMLLDMTRCLLSSPYLKPAHVLERAAKGKNIAWHLMLNSFQKYVYRNHYEQNSFFLNMYDNQNYGNEAHCGRPLTWENALIRPRLLSVLVKRLLQKQPTSDYPDFSLQYIIEDVSKFGYHRVEIIKALKAFADHRIIRTGRKRNELDDNVATISISTAVIFYNDYLIYEYRYLQNILPITPIDFSFNPEDIPDAPETRELHRIDEILFKFADFIERCENQEKNNSSYDELSYSTVCKENEISKRIRKSVKIFKMRVGR